MLQAEELQDLVAIAIWERFLLSWASLEVVG